MMNNKLNCLDYITKTPKIQPIETSMELSNSRKQISNRAYRDWNPSIYRYNEKMLYLEKKNKSWS